jgi:hypothetical protein
MIATKHDRFRAQEGAIFYGTVRPTDDGRFYAWCGARILARSEAKDHGEFNTREDGIKWIESHAAAGGFNDES